MSLWIVAGVIAVFILFALASTLKDQARGRKMAAVCAAAGLPPGNVPLPLGFINLFMGDQKRLENQFTSIADLSCSDKGFTHCYTIAVTYLQGFAVPRIRVARRHTVDEDPLFGDMQKVETESIEFTDRYTIHADDPRSALMLLEPQMQQFILDADSVSFVLMGSSLVAYVYRPMDSNNGTPGALLNLLNPIDVSQVDTLMKFVSAFPQHIPALLRSDYPVPTG